VIRQIKIIGIILAALLLCAITAYITWTFTRPSTITVFGTAAVLKQVQQLNELVTVKYVIEKVVGMSDVNAFGEDRVLLIAHGIVKAGVRLDELKADDVQQGIDGTITLRLPKAKVLDVYLDEKRTQVYERSTGLFRRFNKDLEKQARDNAVDSIRAAAMELDIINEAQSRAEKDIRQFLIVLGFKQVNFKSGVSEPVEPQPKRGFSGGPGTS
jgi:uncharacterized protein YrrD